MKFKKIISAFIFLSVSITSIAAQDVLYKWDCGGGIGLSGYTGEANDGFIFRKPGVAIDLIARYNFNSRLSVATDLGYLGLSGNTADMDNYYPGGDEYKFNSSVYSLSVVGEFNFFPYGIGETYKQLRTWTPYVGLGIGGLMSSASGKISGAFQMPFRIGVKFKLKERLNLNCSLMVSKVFSDRLDGDLTDLYTVKRSFLKNTDWCSSLTVALTYEFGERCPTCNRVN